MITKKPMSKIAWVFTIVVLATGPCVADPAASVTRTELDALREQLRVQQATIQAQADTLRLQQDQIARLGQAQNEHWLNQRRAEEVKTLIREVLSDAETRASLLSDTATAGYDDGFFIASPDQQFRLKLKGLLQLRRVATSRDGSGDDVESGFQLMRANLYFSGHVADPRFRYLIALAQNRNTGAMNVESARLDYDWSHQVTVKVGRFRSFAFTREERVAYTKQLSAERSFTNEVFTVDYVEGMEVLWKADPNVHVRASIHDGAGSGSATMRDFQRDATDFAATGRIDLKLEGDWNQADDFTAWHGEPVAVFVGGAAHYEVGETGTTGANNKFWSFTADASVEANGGNVFVAFIARNGDNETGSDPLQIGVLVQGGVMIIPDTLEPFVRYEFIDFDNLIPVAGQFPRRTGDDTVSIVTVGANYYLARHDAKFTVALQYALDPIPLTFSNTGFLTDAPGEDGQAVLLTQLQMMF